MLFRCRVFFLVRFKLEKVLKPLFFWRPQNKMLLALKIFFIKLQLGGVGCFSSQHTGKSWFHTQLRPGGMRFERERRSDEEKNRTVWWELCSEGIRVILLDSTVHLVNWIFLICFARSDCDELISETNSREHFFCGVCRWTFREC